MWSEDLMIRTFVGEYIPRWIKHGVKDKSSVAVCKTEDKTSECNCVFWCYVRHQSVSVSEEVVANVSSPFFLYCQHYYDTFSYCRGNNALCGSKSNHYVVTEKHQHLPQPESITLLLSEIGRELTLACNSCYARWVESSANSKMEPLKTKLEWTSTTSNCPFSRGGNVRSCRE